jgi:hypothetical protein
MPEYRYELQRGEEVIATGHLSRELRLDLGERMRLEAAQALSTVSSRSSASGNCVWWCN